MIATSESGAVTQTPPSAASTETHSTRRRPNRSPRRPAAVDAPRPAR